MAEREASGSGEALAGTLRELFYAKYSDNITNKKYDDRDVDRFEQDDSYVESFYRDTETKQDAVDRLHENFKFRLEIGSNDLQHDSFPTLYWEKGAIFYRNADKDGHKILFLRVKEHKKDPALLPEVKRFFLYQIELEFRRDPNQQIVVLFDMADAGLSNLDMELIKFVLNLFKVYYPQFLAYLLIFEMPWLFNAAWRIIKTWMGAAAIKKIKFVNKSDVQAYIDKDQVLEHMGGTDKYVYKYEPPMEFPDAADSDISLAAKNKRVTFAENEASSMYKSLSNDSLRSEQDMKVKLPSILGKSRSPSNRRESRDNSFIGRLLTISPAEELVFVMEENTKEAQDSITLQNTLPYSIAYKVKTTSPEKYRVRPSSGIVKAGSKAEVTVHLQHAYQNTVHKDKFLIMAMEMTDDTTDSTAELWKAAQRDSIMEHRLRCIVSNGKDVGSDQGDITHSASDTSKLSELKEKVDQLTERNNSLHRVVKVGIILQILCLFLLLIACAVFYMTPSREPQSGTCSSSDSTCQST